MCKKNESNQNSLHCWNRVFNHVVKCYSGALASEPKPGSHLTFPQQIHDRLYVAHGDYILTFSAFTEKVH